MANLWPDIGMGGGIGKLPPAPSDTGGMNQLRMPGFQPPVRLGGGQAGRAPVFQPPVRLGGGTAGRSPQYQPPWRPSPLQPIGPSGEGQPIGQGGQAALWPEGVNPADLAGSFGQVGGAAGMGGFPGGLDALLMGLIQMGYVPLPAQWHEIQRWLTGGVGPIQGVAAGMNPGVVPPLRQPGYQPPVRL